jgi:hypothetical protein
MTISASVVGAGEHVLYRDVQGASFPAWLWQELHTTWSVAGDERPSILLIQGGAETTALMLNEDLDSLMTFVRTGKDGQS